MLHIKSCFVVFLTMVDSIYSRKSNSIILTIIFLGNFRNEIAAKVSQFFADMYSKIVNTWEPLFSIVKNIFIRERK